MRIEKEQLIELEKIMKLLSEGIDPTSNILFSDDTILNNVVLKRAFLQTSNIFSQLLKRQDVFYKTNPKVSYKMTFHIRRNDYSKIMISKGPITVSRLTYNINNVSNDIYMKRLRATQITCWLVEKGYLSMIHDDETSYKIPTDKGKALGIHSELKLNSKGIKYSVNYYSENAQKFIIENINNITGYNELLIFE